MGRIKGTHRLGKISRAFLSDLADKRKQEVSLNIHKTPLQHAVLYVLLIESKEQWGLRFLTLKALGE